MNTTQLLKIITQSTATCNTNKYLKELSFLNAIRYLELAESFMQSIEFGRFQELSEVEDKETTGKVNELDKDFRSSLPTCENFNYMPYSNYEAFLDAVSDFSTENNLDMSCTIIGIDDIDNILKEMEVIVANLNSLQHALIQY